MAKSRNPNNQGGDRPEQINQTTDADILDNDEQVEDQLNQDEEQVSVSTEELQQVETVAEADGSQPVEAAATASTETPKKKGSNAVWYGVAAVLVAAAVGGVYYSNQSEEKGLTPGTVNQASPGAGSIQEVPADTQGLESNDPPLSADEVPEPSSSDSFDTEMGEEESKANFMGGQATPTDSTATVESSAAPTNGAADDVASAADVVEYQSGVKMSNESSESSEAVEAVEAVEAEQSSDDTAAAEDEVSGERGPIVSPEVGIGAFEQEELAKGEMDKEDMTSTDAPNAEHTPAAEVREQAGSDSAESAEHATATEATSEPETLPEPSTDEPKAETSSEATLPPPTSAEDSTMTTDNPAADTGVKDTVNESDAAASDTTARESEAIADTHPAPMADPNVLAQLEREYELINVRQQQEIRRLQEELSGMRQHLQDQNAGAENLLLNDISRLMQSAENELHFNGNVPNAVSILSVAQRLAAESKNRMLDGLVGAIGADIVALKSNETATVDDMFKQVQQVATLIDTAPLNTPDYASHSQLMLPTVKEAEPGTESVASTEAAEADTQLAADAKWYDRAWSQTKVYASKAYDAVASDLGDLVRVEKLSDPDSGLLSAEQAGIMRNNLKMQLSFAQQGLMSRQQGVWQTSLMTVEQALDQYFRADAAETTQAKMLLAELRKASVQPSMPDISHSRRALSETYEQLRVQRSIQE